MRRLTPLAVLVAASCSAPGQEPQTPLGTLVGPSRSTIGSPENSCSDIAPLWLTQNASTDSERFTAAWTPVYNVETYQVEVASGQSDQHWRWFVSRAEATITAFDGTGRYYVRVRVKNRCDQLGTWSKELTLYLGPEGETSRPVAPTPTQEPAPAPEPAPEGPFRLPRIGGL